MCNRQLLILRVNSPGLSILGISFQSLDIVRERLAIKIHEELVSLLCRSIYTCYRITSSNWRALNGTVFRYPSDQLNRVADMRLVVDLVVDFQPTHCPSVAYCHSRRTIVCFMLAQSRGTVFRMTLHVCFIIDSVSAKTENTFISAVISGHHYMYVTCLWLFSP